MAKSAKTLISLSPSEISPNPHNPRMIFNQEELNELKSSIDKVGILVPVTVYRNTRTFPKTKYVLLDGERRWRCAMELNIKTIPANIIDEPSDITQNILFMFNIHYFRREWELFPTALKLEQLINKLKTDSETTLSNFTGVNRSMIRRCKMLLWYPTKYRDTLMAKNSKISTDFFIELYPIANRLSQEPEYLFPDKVQVFIDSAIQKFLMGVITDVREFRDMRKCMAYYENQNNIKEFKDRVRKFINPPHTSIQVFEVDDLIDDRHRKNITKYTSYLNENLSNIDPNLVTDEYFLNLLKDLRKSIDKLISEIE